MADANGIICLDSGDDCFVLLEELIGTNQNLAAENKKASKNQAEILQQTEQTLHDKESVPHGGWHRSNPQHRSGN